MAVRSRLLGLGFAVAASLGCSSLQVESRCTPDDTRPCVGRGGCEGEQLCDEGRWARCSCEQDPSSDPGVAQDAGSGAYGLDSGVKSFGLGGIAVGDIGGYAAESLLDQGRIVLFAYDADTGVRHEVGTLLLPSVLPGEVSGQIQLPSDGKQQPMVLDAVLDRVPGSATKYTLRGTATAGTAQSSSVHLNSLDFEAAPLRLPSIEGLNGSDAPRRLAFEDAHRGWLAASRPSFARSTTALPPNASEDPFQRYADLTVVYESQDSGESWVEVQQLPGSPRALMLHGEELWVSTSHLLYRSNDSGATFVAPFVTSVHGTLPIVGAMYDVDHAFFFDCLSGRGYSTQDGQTLIEAALELRGELACEGTGSEPTHGMVTRMPTADTVFLLHQTVIDSVATSVLHRSRDGGLTFIEVGPMNDSFVGAPGLVDLGFFDDNYGWVTGWQIGYTTNGGSSWLTTDIPTYDDTSVGAPELVVPFSETQAWMFGPEARVNILSATVDGITLLERALPSDCTRAWDAVAPTPDLAVVLCPAGVAVTQDGGETWAMAEGVQSGGHALFISADGSGILYGDHGIQRTSDGGATFDPPELPIGLLPLAISSSDSFMTVTPKGLLVSNDAGSSYRVLAPGEAGNSGASLLGALDQNVVWWGDIFTRDDGATWRTSDIAAPHFVSPERAYAVEWDRSAFDGTLVRSDDGGASWERVSGATMSPIEVCANAGTAWLTFACEGHEVPNMATGVACPPDVKTRRMVTSLEAELTEVTPLVGQTESLDFPSYTWCDMTSAVLAGTNLGDSRVPASATLVTRHFERALIGPHWFAPSKPSKLLSSSTIELIKAGSGFFGLSSPEDELPGGFAVPSATPLFRLRYLDDAAAFAYRGPAAHHASN